MPGTHAKSKTGNEYLSLHWFKFFLKFILLSHPNSNSTLVGVTRKLVYSFFAPAPPLPTETSNSSWLIWCKGNLESGLASKVITTILKPSSFTLFLLSPSLSSRVSAWHSCQKLNLKKISQPTLPQIFFFKSILLSHPNSNSNSTLVGVTWLWVYSFLAPAPPLPPTQTSNSSWLIWCKGNLEPGLASKVITTILKPSSYTLSLLPPPFPLE